MTSIPIVPIRRQDITPLSHYRFLLFEKGNGHILFDFKRYPIEDNSVYLIPQNRLCFLELKDNDAYTCFDMNPDELRNFDKQLLYAITYTMSGFLSCTYQQEPFRFDLWKTGNYHTLQQYISDFISSQVKSDVISRSIVNCKSNCSFAYAAGFQELLLQGKITHSESYKDQYCNKEAICERTLTRACLEIFGVTSSCMIRQHVMVQAVKQLLHTRAPISQISESMGFNDMQNFTRFIKKQTGYTPTEIRNYFYPLYETGEKKQCLKMIN